MLPQMEESNGVMRQDKDEETKLIMENHGQDKTQATNFLERFSPETPATHNSSIYSSSSSSPSSPPNPLQEPDLSLKLSVGSSSSGGSSSENPLPRSISSIGGNVAIDNKNSVPLDRPCHCTLLPRTGSLPAEAEQQQRLITLREIQSMRRIHAKNRLIAKQRMARVAREKEKKKQQPMPTMPAEVPAWAAASAANSPALSRALLKIKNGKLAARKRGRPAAHSRPSVPGSVKVPYVPKNDEPATNVATSNGFPVKPATPEPENPHKKPRPFSGNFESNGMDVMRQMPTVRTKGNGPNGKRIEGFLYAYTRAHVGIICVCHGSFFSPAEFIRHAGGDDVSNPMKHITVYSTFAT